MKLVATAAWSPNFFFETGSAVYLEGGADISLPYDFTLAGRIGYQWIQRNVRYGAPDYANWSVAVTREVAAGDVRGGAERLTDPPVHIHQGVSLTGAGLGEGAA